MGILTVHEHLLNVAGRWKACDDALDYASQFKTAQEVWDNCKRIDWLFWWAARLGQVEQCSIAAKKIADSVAHYKDISHSNAAANAAVNAAVYDAVNAANTAVYAVYAAA